MDSALIVSSVDKGTLFFNEMLSAASIREIATATSAASAKRLLLDREFDLVIVNAPLIDESGESLSRNIALGSIAQTILVVKTEYFDAISAICEEDGVLTVAKPINRAVFWSALKLAGAAQKQLKRMQAENSMLKQRIEDIRITDRAKYILISCLDMSEQEAHRYIEKQAMDTRTTRRVIAEEILKKYEN
ncbi:MAG: ANTAR domain-containing protein [Oscillospiraceae bacterium]|nr:ANTAR domain-containing protein [Oscillospiraceae bacterium]